MSEDGRPAAAAAFFRSGASNSTYRMELVVSGRIAATLPLPDAASDLSAAMAEKSLVNDVAEMLGVAAADEVDDVAELLELDELELLLELPHPTATADNARTNAHTRNTRALIPARSSQDAQNDTNQL